MPRGALPGKRQGGIDGYELDLSRRVRGMLLNRMTLGPEGGKNKILLQIWGQYKKWYITLCSMIAKKTIISVAAWDVVAAAPKAIPSAVNRSNKKVLLITLCNGQRKMDMICWHMVNHSPAAWTTKPKVAWNDLLFLEVPLSGSV